MWTHKGEEKKRKMRRAEEEAERNPIPSPTKKERDTAKEASLSLQ